MGKIAGVDVHMFVTDGCYLQNINPYPANAENIVSS
jgi:hypothetical protein